MPKEYIASKYLGESEVSGTSKDPEPWVHVGWSKEAEYVEVGVIMPQGFKLEPTPEGNGWFAQLAREDINRMIRVLRKARDQAYGADA